MAKEINEITISVTCTIFDIQERAEEQGLCLTDNQARQCLAHLEESYFCYDILADAHLDAVIAATLAKEEVNGQK